MPLPAKKNAAAPRRGIQVRELALLAVLLWAGAILFAQFKVFKPLKETRAALAIEQKNIEAQQPVLDEAPEINERLAAHIKRLKSTQSLKSGASLQGLVDEIARQVKLVPAELSEVPAGKKRAENKSGVQIFTVRLTFRDATLDKLLAFDDRLREQTIPLTVTSVKVTAMPPQRSRVGGVEVNYTISTHRIADDEAATAAAKPAGVAATTKR
ncbi:MAG: hypothetical protein LBR07_03720 [Puniceicoccales bacterium]|jgi:cell division protein FtsB|nr:hypothetical protein [Puniceicoccales bacterium]